MELKSALGILSLLVGAYGYFPYMRDILRDQTKPHAFSWLSWGLVSGITFFAQTFENAGPGAWISAFTFFMCMAVFILALRKGEKNILPIDWCCLILSLLAIVFWLSTSTPIWSVILVIISDCVGFIPTIRKSLSRPFEETMLIYALSALKFLLALLAIKEYSAATVLYPTYMIVINSAFVTLLICLRARTSNRSDLFNRSLS